MAFIFNAISLKNRSMELLGNNECSELVDN